MSIEEILKKAEEKPTATATKEDLLIQFINMQREYYEDMKEMAHQHAKLASDLINLQLGINDNSAAEPSPIPELDADLLGGEIGTSETSRDQEE